MLARVDRLVPDRVDLVSKRHRGRVDRRLARLCPRAHRARETARTRGRVGLVGVVRVCRRSRLLFVVVEQQRCDRVRRRRWTLCLATRRPSVRSERQHCRRRRRVGVESSKRFDRGLVDLDDRERLVAVMVGTRRRDRGSRGTLSLFRSSFFSKSFDLT